MQQLTEEEIQRIRARIHELDIEHRDLDAAILHLESTGYRDEISISRLKKRKLSLKDMLNQLQMMLVPDEPA
jgi:hypothetical protein